MRSIFEWLEEHRDWVIELLRMYLGFVLIVKGFYFLRNMDELLALAGIQGTLWVSGIFGHYIALSHIIGGAFVVIGMITRASIFFQLPILLGGVAVVYKKEGMLAGGSNFEYTLLVFLLLVMFLFYGGGRLSVDYFLSKSNERNMEMERQKQAS